MPKIFLDISGSNETITRPVIQGVTEDIAAALGLPQKTVVTYPGDSDPTQLKVTSALTEAQRLTFPEQANVVIMPEERWLDKDVATMRLNDREQRPLFRDPELGVTLAPVYASSEVIINLEFSLPDRNEALRLLNDFRRHSTLFRDSIIHELRYRYLLPETIYVILAEIQRKKEQRGINTESMSDWFKRCFNEQMTTNSTLNGEHVRFAKEEIQSNVMGWFDYDITPENPEANDTKTKHELKFQYRFVYDKVISLAMTYPILIHNLPISSKFYDQTIPYQLPMRSQSRSQTMQSLDHFTFNQQVANPRHGLPIPAFCEWEPEHRPAWTEGLLRLMIQVNPNKPRNLVNLTQLGKVSIDEYLIDYMKSSYSQLSKYKRSAIYVTLYEDGKRVGDEKIHIDEDLTATTMFDMDLTKNYHIWVAVYTGLHLMSPEHQEDIRKAGPLGNDLLILVAHYHNVRLQQLKTNDMGRLDKKQYHDAITKIKQSKLPQAGHLRKDNYFVGHFIIVS